MDTTVDSTPSNITHTNNNLDINEPLITQDMNSQKKIVKVSGPIPFSSLLIILTELCERFAFYGASLLFIPYLTQKLNLSTVTSTFLNRSFQLIAYLTTLIGAYLADVKLGRYKAILYFSVIYFIGLILLSLSASSKLSSNHKLGLIGFIVSVFLFIAWGTGGIKANVSAFAAEQVPYSNKLATNNIIATNNEQIVKVYDYNLTVERIFRYFYLAINVGSLLGQLICPVVYHKYDNGAMYAFLIPSLIFLVGILVFYMGKNRYNVPNNCSSNSNNNERKDPMGKIVRCLKFAYSQKRLNSNNNISKPHFLDYAKDSTNNNNSNNEFYSEEYIEDIKQMLKACKVFIFYVVYWALYNNMSDAFIIMGTRMRKPSWISGVEQLNIINSLVLVIAIPIFDRYIFPFLRTKGFRMDPLNRISIGFMICFVTFVYACALQYKIYNTEPYYDFTGRLPPNIEDQYNNISLYYQVGLYGLIAVSEIFASATGLEYAFKLASKDLKSIVLALFLLTNCGGSLLGLIMAYWSYDPNYVNLFGVQALAMLLVTVVFHKMFNNKTNEANKLVVVRIE